MKLKRTCFILEALIVESVFLGTEALRVQLLTYNAFHLAALMQKHGK